MGIGFAIPINLVRELLPQLRVGKITRGRIGVGIGADTPDAVDEFGLKDRNGAVVLNLAPGGAAAKAGLEPGDVIVGYNGKPIRNRDELVAMVTATKPGTTVPLRVVRDRQERTISVTVEELDLETEASALRSDNRGRRGSPAGRDNQRVRRDARQPHAADGAAASPRSRRSGGGGDRCGAG